MTGKLIIFSAPSGAGKSTIVKKVMEQIDSLQFSISATSRKPREGEVDGKSYYFIESELFKKKIQNNEFLEWEEVYTDTFYGTLKSEIDRIFGEGKHVIFDVDVVGGVNIKSKFGNQALSIFIQPPSIEILEERLRNRGTETEESLAKRMNKFIFELDFASKFDEVILNDDLNTAVGQTLALIKKFLSQDK